MSKSFKARLVEAETLCPEVRHFVLEALRDEPFDFEPGQYVKLTVGRGGLFEERYYSIASAPDGGRRFELCVATGDDKIGRYLATAAAGERFACHGPGGTFRAGPAGRDALFVSHGTGVAPLRAMIEARIGREDRSAGRRVVLLHGARTPDRLLYHDRFADLAKSRPTFEFQPTVSRPGGGWEGRRGRVQTHLAEALRSLSGDLDVHLCGRPEMVTDLRERLAEAGVPETDIHYERFLTRTVGGLHRHRNRRPSAHLPKNPTSYPGNPASAWPMIVFGLAYEVRTVKGGSHARPFRNSISHADLRFLPVSIAAIVGLKAPHSISTRETLRR